MSDPQVTDLLGNPVSIGDRVVVVFKEEQVRVGIVASFGTRIYAGQLRRTMGVDWETGTRWMPSSKATSVDLDSRVFIKLFPEK